jgi:hypothetical protein
MTNQEAGAALAIVRKLRQKELSGSKVISGERVMNRRNFDGDEAADLIEELVEVLKEASQLSLDELFEWQRRKARALLAKLEAGEGE